PALLRPQGFCQNSYPYSHSHSQVQSRRQMPCQVDRCGEINEELDTLGQWKAGTNQPISQGAHNRRHPKTGDLYALQYSVETPLVHIHRIDAVGQLQDTISVELPMPTMIHDFVLTERHIILVAGPAVFDIEAARAGKPILQWR